MTQLARLLRYGRRFIGDRQYRNRVLDMVDRHARGALDVATTEAGGDLAAGKFLQGRSVFVAAGCELTFLAEQLERYGARVHHAFAHGRPSDPLTEVMTPGSAALTAGWDYYLLSVSQVFRHLVYRVQTAGPDYPREAQEKDLAAVIDNYRRAIHRLREVSGAPIFLYTYFLGYRPSYGYHEYRTVRAGLSLVELLHTFHLRVYQLAREEAAVYVLDADVALADTGKAGAVDLETSNGVYDHPNRVGAQRLGAQLVKQLGVLEPGGRRVKCAVFDLDGTLWAGVLREDGPGGVAVRQYHLQVLELLAARGILLAICSKNDEADREHLPALLGENVWPKVVSAHLGWKPKSEMLQDIARELHLGMESLAFFDDSEFERAEVAANAPQVLTFAPDDIFASVNRVELQPAGEVTAEALTRTTKYHDDARRHGAERAERSAGRGLEEFLKTCDLRLQLRAPLPGEVSRVFELLQRTNQLNATLHRASMAQLAAYVAHPETHVLRVATLGDRFGDYGLIGFAACERQGDTWEVLDLAFSCRCAGRGVEQAILNHLGTVARAEGAAYQVIDFVRGPRNGQMYDILLACGFAPASGARPTRGGAVHLVRPLQGAVLRAPEWLQVETVAA